MNVAYGYTVLENDPFLEVTRQAIHYLAVGTMTQFWVNWFPILKYLPSWLPGGEFKRIGERGRSYRESYMQIPFQAVTDPISQGHIVIPSFTSRVLAEKGGLGASAEDTNLVKISAAAFFLAGTTTTNAFIATFMLMMAVYPELAAEAQREIDALESQDRLPNLEDREALPYVDAFIQEVMRLSPPVPFGLAHETTEDVMYEGYHIPKGTTIRANIWALLHDPRAYANPHTFDPKRYLKAVPDPDPREFIFGFGRRSCPGVHLANNGTWLTCVGLLWAFEVSASHELVNRVAEIGGKDSPDFYKLFQPHGVSIEPLPFKCKINPRRDDFMKILRQFISL
ncbi:hypothetical protein FRC09_003767 [Ceratobasidium sp. 395]|nr:hypothetical protein FRC09_003767 [Ceratobasidium sp. 395]